MGVTQAITLEFWGCNRMDNAKKGKNVDLFVETRENRTLMALQDRAERQSGFAH
jgi:hypothetical protein